MKLTPSQSTLVNAVLAILGSVAILFVTHISLYFANNTLNFAGLGAYALALLATIGAGVWGYIEAHPQQVVQAAEDTAQELHVPAASINLVHQKLDSLYILLSTMFAQQQQVAPQHPLSVQSISQAPVAPVASSVAPESVVNPLSGLDLSALTATTLPRVQVVSAAQ